MLTVVKVLCIALSILLFGGSIGFVINAIKFNNDNNDNLTQILTQIVVFLVSLLIAFAPISWIVL
ncbi:MAG: hypothetical protein ACQEQD_04525 [Bacillota bacterium]